MRVRFQGMRHRQNVDDGRQFGRRWNLDRAWDVGLSVGSGDPYRDDGEDVTVLQGDDFAVRSSSSFFVAWVWP